MLTDDEIRRKATDTSTQSALSGVTSKDGLLWKDGAVIGLPEADRLAWLCGLHCAEQLVRILAR